MQRERVSEDIYVFTSDLYAQVTAGVIITNQGAVIIDTMPYPEETQEILRFVETRLRTDVTHVINTHFHADHTMGTCYFTGAQVIGHRLCRQLLDLRGRESLEIARATSGTMQDITLILPTLVFDQALTLYVGNKTFHLWHTPGHSPDSIVCYVEQDQVLFGADTLMPIPYFVDGSFDAFVGSLKALKARQLPMEAIVQGHGEVILRGEVEDKIEDDLRYLTRLHDAVMAAIQAGEGDEAIDAITIESCGKSHILLNGAAQQLHRQNVFTLAEWLRRDVALQYNPSADGSRDNGAETSDQQ